MCALFTLMLSQSFSVFQSKEELLQSLHKMPGVNLLLFVSQLAQQKCKQQSRFAVFSLTALTQRLEEPDVKTVGDFLS